MARGKKKESVLTPEEKLAQALVPVEAQPYKVPENWCWVYLPNVCEYMRAGGDKPNIFSEEKTAELNIPVVANGIQNEGIIGFTDVENEKAGTVTVSGRGTIGYPILREYPYYPVVRLIVLAPNKVILPSYLKNVFFCLEEEGTGSSIPQLTVPMLKGKVIPIAPLNEQQRIVDRIEYLFAKLDEAKEKAQSVLDSFETRKAAILHKAFTGELTAKWRAEHGVVKSTWATKKVGEFAEVKGGKRLPKGHVLTTEKTDHPYLRIADFGEGTIDQSDLHYITNETYAEISRYIITSEDVYLSIVGSIGKTGVIPKELDGANLTENAARIISQCTLPKYLCAYLSSPTTQDDIQGRIRSATLGKLSLLNIKDISVPIPTKEEQAEIVRILDSLFSKEQQAKEAAEAVLEKIDLLKKSILARAFRGELGTNDPNEESAVELLKQIAQ